MTEKLPDWADNALRVYEASLKSREIGLAPVIAPLVTLEEGIESLSQEQREIVTERVMQIGIDQLREIKKYGKTSDDDYFFFSGNIALYLQNIRHAFPTEESYDRNVCHNLFRLIMESKNRLASNILDDCLKVKKDWKLYRELYN